MLLEEDAYVKNYEEIDAVEEMGWDYVWLGGGHFSKQASMDPQVLLLAAVIAEAHQQDQDRVVHSPAGDKAAGRDAIPRGAAA